MTTMCTPAAMLALLLGLCLLATPCHSEANLTITYSVADLSTIVLLGNDEIQLEAYKVTSENPDMFYWVSVGEPRLIRQPIGGESAGIFHWASDEVTLWIRTLTLSMRNALAKQASSEYSRSISQEQIGHVPLSDLDCTIRLRDHKGRAYLLHGQTSHVRRFPLRVDFPAPRSSVERELLKKETADERTAPTVSCILMAEGKPGRTTSFQLTRKLMEQHSVVTRLFNQSDEVMVNGAQLVALASELYTSLNILEEYEIPEFTFIKLFNYGLLQQTAITTFQQVPIKDARAAMSGFGLSGDGDRSIGRIILGLGSIMTVNTEPDGERHIVINQDRVKYLIEQGRAAMTDPDKASVFAAMNIGERLRVLAEKIEVNATFEEQLATLNTHQDGEMKWKVENDKVVPVTIKTAKLARSAFEQTLYFPRIQKVDMLAQFKATYQLKLDQAVPPWDENDKRWRSSISTDEVLGVDPVMKANIEHIRSQQERFAQFAVSVIDGLRVDVQYLNESSNAFQREYTTTATKARKESMTEWTSLSSVESHFENDQSYPDWKERNVTLIHYACMKGHLEAAKVLLQRGENVNSKTNNGETPLHFASEGGHASVVRMLLFHGAHVDVYTNNHRYTPLHVASQHGNFETVEILVANGADTGALTSSGRTPLKLATESKIRSVIRKHGGVE